MADSRISVIVVSFNTRDQLRRCLGCIETDHEVIVVDNASSDGSVAMVQAEFEHVRMIANADNRGFSAANNQGIAVATRHLVLFLNSDAYAEPGAISRLADVFEDEKVAAAGGRLLNLDGSRQESVAGRLTLGMVFLEQTMLDRVLRRLGGGYWRTPAGEETVPVDQVMGACLMTRRSFGERFDERFFLYCEDTELCRRLAARGQILYCPPARFIHELGSSSSGNRWLAVARYNRGKELYFELTAGVGASWACIALDRFGAVVRLLGWSLVSVAKPSARGQVALFWKVLCSPLVRDPVSRFDGTRYTL